MADDIGDGATKGWRRREFLRTGGLATLALGLPYGCSGDDKGNEPGADGGADSVLPGRDPFTIVMLPDTQIYADHHPEVYTAQTQWVVDNQKSENIAFVSHVGDVVDNGPSVRQWKNAQASMKLLDDADIPYGISLGNHDVHYSDQEFQYPANVDHSCSPLKDFDCTASHFLDAFGPQHFADRSWFGGASTSGLSSYQQITVAGTKLIFLHLALDHPKAEVAWAQQVIDQHGDAAIHLTTHRYLYDFRLVKGLPLPLGGLLGGRYGSLNYTVDDPLHFSDGLAADQLFAQFIKKNTNIFMVQCGHVDGEYQQTSKNEAGLPVHEMMADFQTFGAAAEGWMRVLRFDLDAKQVHVRTYSPKLGRYRENGEGLNDALNALETGIQYFGGQYKDIIDVPALRKQLDYWQKDPAGRAEYSELLYGEGKRDSDFTLDLDLAAYLAA